MTHLLDADKWVKYTPDGEELHIMDTQKIVWGTIPMTSGMEIEQRYEDIIRCGNILLRAYDWHFDGSGPFETALPPSIAPYKEIKKFITLVNRLECQWEWVGWFYRDGREIGCGSHIHFRPRPSLRQIALHTMAPEEERVPGIMSDPPYPHPDYIQLGDVWETAYNTIIETWIWLLPLFCVGDRYIMRCRRTVVEWAEVSYERVTEDNMSYYLSSKYVDHPYDAVALNRRTPDRPLTIEIRVNENHPAIAYVTMLLFNRLVRKMYERKYIAPEMALDPQARKDLYMSLYNAVEYSATQNKDLYEALEDTYERFMHLYGPVEFEQGYDIPGVPRRVTSYFTFFKKLLYAYLHFMNPVEYRVYQLYANKGIPRRNWRKLWQLFEVPAGEFCWDSPYICKL